MFALCLSVGWKHSTAPGGILWSAGVCRGEEMGVCRGEGMGVCREEEMGREVVNVCTNSN